MRRPATDALARSYLDLLDGTLALIVLVVALVSANPGASASGVSPALAGAPLGLVAVAFQAGPATGVDPNVLLAIAKVETDWGQARNGQPHDLVPANLRADVDAAALQAGGATATMLRLEDGWRLGDWVDPQPVGPAQEHAMGLMQFLPSTWRVETAAAPGRPHDPYQPAEAMVTAGSYLHRLETGAAGGVPHDPRGALAVYGGSLRSGRGCRLALGRARPVASRGRFGSDRRSRVLKDDRRALVVAAGAAQRAADYVLDRQPARGGDGRAVERPARTW